MFTAKPCPYCGNNPVPHAVNWYFESVNVLFTPLRSVLLQNPLSKAIKRLAARVGFGTAAVNFFSALGLVRVQHDKTLCKVDRALDLWDEAERRGIVMNELLLLGKPFDTYIATKQDKAIVFTGLPRPVGYDDSALDTLDDKFMLKEKFLAAGLPVPQGGSATRLAVALKIFRKLQKPVIVKPRTGSRGRHSTTHIHTEEQLAAAFGVAKQLCHWVIVEEHVQGPVYRATVIDYRLRGMLRGDSPSVVGDGARSIGRLMEQWNKTDHAGISDIASTGQTELFLQRQGLNLSSVPAAGQRVFLSEKIGVRYGGSSSEDLAVTHPDNKAVCERAARVAGDPIVGFDFIIPDISQSYKQQRCGFIEANSLPFINLHSHPLKGTPQHLGGYIWDLVGF